MQIQNRTLLNKDNFLMAATRAPEVNLMQRIIDKQRSNKQILDLQKQGAVTCIDSVLYFQGKVIIPCKLVSAVLFECHDQLLVGNPGSQKTFTVVNRSYWWPSVHKDVNNYVQSCGVYSCVKST